MKGFVKLIYMTANIFTIRQIKNYWHEGVKTIVMLYNLVEPGNKRGNHRCLQWNLRPKSVLSAVGNIEKPVFILFLLIYCRHDSTCKQQTANSKQMTMSCTFTDPEADDKFLRERLYIYIYARVYLWVGGHYPQI